MSCPFRTIKKLKTVKGRVRKNGFLEEEIVLASQSTTVTHNDSSGYLALLSPEARERYLRRLSR
jgi:hypothetical protein